jgi:hypothetical protein
MAVSIAQYVDLLFKKLQGVAKTANSTVKGASNESIASPAFLRGDVVWMQSDQIPGTAQVVTGVTSALTGGSSIQCIADTTVPPIGGIRPTWLTNEPYWVSQEFGSTWLPKVFVGPASAANIEATGTQIFAAGIGGAGEYYFDTQAGVLNFIGETIPTVLTAGNVVYVSGYQYVGDLGVTNIPSGANIGNLTITDTTITPTGNLVIFSGTEGIVIPAGNTAQRPSPAQTGTIRINTALAQIEAWDGADWISGGGGGGGNVTISDQQITPDGTSVTYGLDQDTNAVSILVSFNGVAQLPGVAYTVTGNSITFASAPLPTDAVDIRFLATATTRDAILNSTGNSGVTVTEIPTINMYVNSSNIANVTSNGILVNGIVSATGNVTGNYIFGNGSLLTGIITSVANINSGTSNVTVVSSGGNVSVGVGGTSNVTVFATTGAFVTGVVSATGNVTSGNVITGGLISATGNVTSGNLLTSGLISATGSVTGAVISIPAGALTLTNQGSVNDIIAGTKNVGQVIIGGTTQTGAITVGQSTATQSLSLASGVTSSGNTKTISIGQSGASGSNTNITMGPSAGVGTVNIGSGTTVVVANTSGTALSVAGNITGGNLSVGTGTITGGNIVNSNANGVGNIGSSTTYFNTVFAMATSAQYADLAEMYLADANYTAGTVLCFGGSAEVTQCNANMSPTVIGVVSTHPAYQMNTGLSGNCVVAVALMGRVPCLVIGPVTRGAMMVSAGNGHARAETNPAMGTVIGKALENFEGNVGIIEVVVGRL